MLTTLRGFYSGKKKRHTLKSQVVVDLASGAIICTAHAKGRVHDFRLFKQSRLGIDAKTQVLADKGYQGILKLHAKGNCFEISVLADISKGIAQ